MGTRVVTRVPMLSTQFHDIKSCVADSVIFLTTLYDIISSQWLYTCNHGQTPCLLNMNSLILESTTQRPLIPWNRQAPCSLCCVMCITTYEAGSLAAHYATEWREGAPSLGGHFMFLNAWELGNLVLSPLFPAPWNTEWPQDQPLLLHIKVWDGRFCHLLGHIIWHNLLVIIITKIMCFVEYTFFFGKNIIEYAIPDLYAIEWSCPCPCQAGRFYQFRSFWDQLSSHFSRTSRVGA